MERGRKTEVTQEYQRKRHIRGMSRVASVLLVFQPQGDGVSIIVFLRISHLHPFEMGISWPLYVKEVK